MKLGSVVFTENIEIEIRINIGQLNAELGAQTFGKAEVILFKPVLRVLVAHRSARGGEEEKGQIFVRTRHSGLFPIRDDGVNVNIGHRVKRICLVISRVVILVFVREVNTALPSPLEQR